MHPALKAFVRQFLGVVVITLVPVVLTTFISIPFSLERVPGAGDVAVTAMERHMT